MTALGLPSDATSADVKKAYRGLLKVYRPERDPAGFQKLREVHDRALAIVAARDASGAGSARRTASDGPTDEDAVARRLKDIELQALMNEAQRAASEDPAMIPIRENTPAEEEWDDEVDEPDDGPASLTAPDFPPKGEREAVEAALRNGDADGAMQRLVELRDVWKMRDPEGWAFWLTELATPYVFTAPDTIAVRLIGEASTCDVGSSWLFDRIELLRLRLEVGRELKHAERTGLLPKPFIEFVRTSIDADPVRMLHGVEVAWQRAVSKEWAVRKLSRLDDVLPETSDAWDSIQQRCSMVIGDRLESAHGEGFVERTVEEFLSNEKGMTAKEPRWLRPGFEHRLWYALILLLLAGASTTWSSSGRFSFVTIVLVLAAVALGVNWVVSASRYARFKVRLREHLFSHGIPLPIVTAMMEQSLQLGTRAANWLPLLEREHGLSLESLAWGVARTRSGDPER